jgi:hypothetical protein
MAQFIKGKGIVLSNDDEELFNEINAELDIERQKELEEAQQNVEWHRKNSIASEIGEPNN